MESQTNKTFMDGTEGAPTAGGAKQRSTKTKTTSQFVLRFLALLLTLAAAIVLGVDKQTKFVPVPISPSLPPFNIPVTAKWKHLSAFVYAVVSNAIACSYAAISLLLILSVTKRNGGLNGGLRLMIILLDLAMVALLFSSNGAAGAVGLLGYKGNSHVMWNKVCDKFGKFCNQVAASLVLSLLGSITFLFLVALEAL